MSIAENKSTATISALDREGFFPAAMVNITNRCNLKCRHCFIYSDANPNSPKGEMSDAAMLYQLATLQKKFGILKMLWMGGEPLLRPGVLREGVKLFAANTITTNGTRELIELPNCTYVVSLDGPPAINDAIRGHGTFAKVIKTLAHLPDSFASTVMVQCVVTRTNEAGLEELVDRLQPTRVQGMTFSFYVPRSNDEGPHTWGSLERRDAAVRKAMALKDRYPDFIWNNRRSLELTLSPNAPAVTANCLSKKFVLPLYLEGDRFVTPFCCYGNDVDCDLCGAWVVFYMAAKFEASEWRSLLKTDGRPMQKREAGI